jgi:hypothetical protein
VTSGNAALDARRGRPADHARRLGELDVQPRRPLLPVRAEADAAGDREEIGSDFRGYVEGAYKANGVVFACMLVGCCCSRRRGSSSADAQRAPGDLFGTPALARLEKPWPNATTGDLLTGRSRTPTCAATSTAGGPDGVERMRPDWVTIVLGSRDRNAQVGDLGIEVVGYIYHPGGRNSGRDPVPLLREEVAHFAPIPDPAASFRGMSWLTPVIREVLADGAATTHKLKFFENGATPNMIVSSRPRSAAGVRAVQGDLRGEPQRVSNAYETLFLGGGADATVVGADMKQLDFKVTQGAGETRIAAAAGVPPVIVGLSEGLQAATYSNYSRRAAVRGRHDAAAVAQRPGRSRRSSTSPRAELWYDDRDIPFLQEDLKDAADIQQTQANSIHELIAAGFTPDSVITAVTSGDLTRLEHTGMYSVQLQPAGTVGEGKGSEVTGTPVATNGNGAPAPASQPNS